MLLTPEELEQMTGRKQPAAQLRPPKSYVAARLEELEADRRFRKKVTPVNVGPLRGPRDSDAWTSPATDELDRIDPTTLPLVTNAARRPGVYFLFIDEKLVYIGVADDVCKRVMSHFTYRSQAFHQARYLPVPWPWHLAVEAHLIARFRPPRNVIAKRKP